MPHDQPRALIELLRTAPMPGLPEGLHYPDQLRDIAERAGVEMAPAFSLDDYLLEIRERLYGAGPATAESGDVPSRPAGAVAEEGGRCPAPTLDDVRPVARLRDRLAAALAETSDAECAAALSELSRRSDLYPGLDVTCRPVVMPRGGDFVAHVSAALLAAAIDLVASGRRSRIKGCEGPECGLPFLDGSRDGRGRFCSRRCSNRHAARRRREPRTGPPDPPVGRWNG